jgi:DNA polymerase-3 subunit delta'
MTHPKSKIQNPKSAWPVIGHDWAVALLQRAVESQHQTHAYLFTGPEHIGRRTLALALARALNCTSAPAPCDMATQDPPPCRACRLIAAGNHPDMRVVTPDGASIKIDQIRALQHDLALSPVEARFRVAIIDGMELATTEAANALLKTLEEPPAYVVLALIAPEPENLLPTIVSRCQPIPLRPLAVDQVRQALASQWNADAQQADLLAHLAGGRLGWAVGALQDETVLQTRATRLDDLVRLTGAKRVERFAYAEEMAGNQAAALDTLTLWETWWRDVMLLAAQSQTALVNTDRLSTLKQHAERFGAARARAALAAIARAVWQIKHNANARLTLEVLLLDLP